jgi:hypothetical protein
MMYVADMTHFVGADELVGAKFNVARRFAAYLGAVVGVATANPPGPVIESPLPCHRRPSRQPCPGKLLVRRSEAPRQINWACPRCGEEGVISNFEQTIWDLSPPLTIDGVEKSALVGPDQYRRLLSVHLLDPDAQRVLHAAQLMGNAVLLRAGEDDFEHLVESVAAEANHEPAHSRRRGLDDVLAVLEGAFAQAMANPQIAIGVRSDQLRTQGG